MGCSWVGERSEKSWDQQENFGYLQGKCLDCCFVRDLYPQGGTLIFTAYVGSGPSIYCSPQKISGISSTPKNIWNFGNPKKYPRFLKLTLKKALKCIKMTTKRSPILWCPQRNIHKIFIPQKILKFKILNLKKWPEPRYVWKYLSTPSLEYPPGLIPKILDQCGAHCLLILCVTADFVLTHVFTLVAKELQWEGGKK